jgi:N-acetylglutamate synthase-like GNAT family acetyltransferase
MPHIDVRPAATSEQQALEALQRRASLKNPGDREALLAHPDAIELPVQQIEAGGVFVAEADGAVVGFAALLPRADGNSELDALFVEPACWRRGVGRALVAHCCTVARASGAASIHVIGNPHAEGFYRACGFEVSGTQQMRFGIGLLMQCILPGS